MAWFSLFWGGIPFCMAAGIGGCGVVATAVAGRDVARVGTNTGVLRRVWCRVAGRDGIRGGNPLYGPGVFILTVVAEFSNQSLRKCLRFDFCRAFKQPHMKSLYLFGFSLLGGVTALFGAAGWSSFKHKKVPEHAVLFRWFVAGLVMVGLAAYVWLFGANGDISQIMNQMNNSFDLSTLTKLASVSTLIAGAGASVSQNTDGSEAANTEQQGQGDVPELTVGMPAF